MEKVISLTYKFINLITEISPENGARLIDKFILGITGNPIIGWAFFKKDAAILRRTGGLKRICVIADVHIGDAIISQSAISALRNSFPEAQIDYIFNKTAESVIAGNPEISNLYPVYVSSGLPYPSESEAEAIKGILAKSDYDFILDLCPFLPAKKIRSSGKVMNHLGLVMSIAQAQKDPEAKSHMVSQLYRHIQSVLEKKNTERRKDSPGVNIYLSEDARKQASKILRDNGLDLKTPKIFFNPDASTPFTRIPADIQISLLKELLKFPYQILLGASRDESGFEDRILNGLRMSDRRKITIVPTALPIDAYAALIDLCDVFITGDTGPLHIAAARKIPKLGGRPFRNKTAILSIFGATPSRLYGYDSQKPGFFPANQEAPSRAYVPLSSTRNLAYIVKKYIAADGRSFFNNLDMDEIASDVRTFIGSPFPVREKPVR